MWQGTWTTRTWFTSSPTERKRTRSKPFSTPFLPVCDLKLAHCTGRRRGLWCIDASLFWYSLKSTRGSRQNVPGPKNGQINSIHIVSCPAPFQHFPHYVPDWLNYSSSSFYTLKTTFTFHRKCVRSLHVRLIKVFERQQPASNSDYSEAFIKMLRAWGTT